MLSMMPYADIFIFIIIIYFIDAITPHYDAAAADDIIITMPRRYYADMARC